MITMSKAYKLCGCDGVYLCPIDEHEYFGAVWLSDKKIRENLDMKKIKVIRIYPHISISNGEYLGEEFFVTGITRKELRRILAK